MSDHINLFTALSISTASEYFRDLEASEFPPGTVFTDSDGGEAKVIEGASGEHHLMVNGHSVIQSKVWHKAKATDAQGHTVGPRGSTLFEGKYLYHPGTMGRLFQRESDRELYLCVYGMGITDDDGDTVYALGITDPSVKLTDDYVSLRWLKHGDVTLAGRPSASTGIRA